MDVSLVTMTADRPRAIAICQRWVERMVETAVAHNPGLRIEWIVADGGSQKLPLTFSMVPRTLHLVTLAPQHDPRANFRHNLRCGLQAARGKKIVIVEDDDWYHPEYLCAQLHWLEGHELAGEARTKYYHVAHRVWHQNNNQVHASLCQTAMSHATAQKLIAWLEAYRGRSAMVDIHLWGPHIVKGSRNLVRTPDDCPLCVGMKGLPGRGGLGMGHRMHRRGHRADPGMKTLQRWIGDDAIVYAELASETSVA